MVLLRWYGLTKTQLLKREHVLGQAPQGAEAVVRAAMGLLFRDIVAGKFDSPVLVTMRGRRATEWILREQDPAHTDDVFRALARRDEAVAVAGILRAIVPAEMGSLGAWLVAGECLGERFEVVIGIEPAGQDGRPGFQTRGRRRSGADITWFGVAPRSRVELVPEGPARMPKTWGEA